jgi:hypothetical protein
MQEETRIETGPERQQAGGEPEWNAVDMDLRQSAERRLGTTGMIARWT